MNYILVTFNGYRYEITPEQKNYIKGLSANAPFSIDKVGLNTNDIYNIEKAYLTKKHQKRLKNLKNGFLKGVAKVRGEGQVAYKGLDEYQKRTYNRMERSLQDLETIGGMPGDDRMDNRMVVGIDN